jgi:hypothetical protein
MFSSAVKNGSRTVFLIDYPYAPVKGIGRTAQFYRLAEQSEFSRSLLKDSGEYVYERGFSGSVFTDKSMNLSFFQREVDIVESNDPGKLLPDRDHFNNLHDYLPKCFE